MTVARHLMHLGQAEGTAGFSGLGPSQHPIPLDTEGLTTGQRGPTASQGLGKSGSEKVSPMGLESHPPPPWFFLYPSVEFQFFRGMYDCSLWGSMGLSEGKPG